MAWALKRYKPLVMSLIFKRLGRGYCEHDCYTCQFLFSADDGIIRIATYVQLQSLDPLIHEREKQGPL